MTFTGELNRTISRTYSIHMSKEYEMKAFTSAEEFQKYSEQVKARVAEREKKTQVKVHLGTCGISSGAREVLERFENEVKARGLTDVVILRASCIGLCGIEPVVTVVCPGQDRVIYKELDESFVPRIIEQHILGGEEVEEWTVDQEMPLIKKQEIRVMHNQDIDPMDIDEYIARDGYQALAKVLQSGNPEDVIEEINKAGLRGRGGAGFPTARKWSFVRSAESDEKHVVCNGDEGDPGAYMNRAVLEGNPHSIIEGMAIGAYGIGNVSQGYAYVRAEYPLAISTLKHAIKQAMEYGLLGDNILGTDFSFALDIFPGAGAFVCGEETALLHSIEGERGNPRQRPPFPANVGGGLFGKPTTINNVETWSNIPQLIWKGADWFASVGSENCKGTKVLCLAGNAKNTGLVEVPLGMTLGEIVFDIGDGIAGGKEFKAVQMGGPSGGFLSAAHLNTPVDYESVPATGAIMGSGGMVVMDENSCMVDMAKYFLGFTRDESCGKCTPCRAGIPKMLEILEKISRGEGEMEDLDKLEVLTEMIPDAALCGLGQTAPNPVITGLRHFRDEFEKHIIDKTCPAAVCTSVFTSPCQHTCPVELDIPGYISLIKDGQFADAYKLIKQRNPLPAVCGRVCHHPCEVKCNRARQDEALMIRELKRFAADYAYLSGVESDFTPRSDKPERVAVIGSGPAGLSAAWDLALEGYKVDIFEAQPVAGGMLATAIPEYRLPKYILQKEIEDIARLGVDIKINSPVDNPASLFEKGYQAVFIATGSAKGMTAGVPGEDLDGIYDAIKFLRSVNLKEGIKIGKRVAVIGGGNSAIDSARTALRLGADAVHIIYRRTENDMTAQWEEIMDAKDEGMTLAAESEEIRDAREEGVHIHELTNPVEILGKNGKVTGVKCIRMELKEFDRSARKTPYPVEGSEFELEVDTVIQAIGQQPEIEFLKGTGIQTSESGTVIIDGKAMTTSVPGIFAGGDVATGPKTVIECIAAGQKAAASIARYLQKLDASAEYRRNEGADTEYSSTLPTDEEVRERNRMDVHKIPAGVRNRIFAEVTLTMNPEEARAEASRCLRCDLEV
ncbi:MAG: FAD-dependent oxidoreductase [Dehalococcoidales bacterium]|nr:FAD-dependent oxidoreductase [Dehalococcoidales bacterium]